ncbi:MAG: MFS transporter [Geobacteraceae bacterium]
MVFWLAAIPGGLAVLLVVVKVRDVARDIGANEKFPTGFPCGRLRSYLLILFLFTLGNSSDAFLLLRAGQLGVTPYRIPLLWAFFHMVKMLSSMPLGALSDRVGRRVLIMAGWVVYAITYAGFAFAESERHVWLLFAVYGVFYGLTEGVEKALVADIAPAGERGGAFGWYNFAIGAGALPASLIFGLIWQHASAQAAFGFGAALALLAAFLFFLFVPTVIPISNQRCSQGGED